MNAPPRWRIVFVALFGFVVFGTITVRLYQIQVLDHEFYKSIWNDQHGRAPKIERQRGTVYDRRGREVAVSLPVRSLYANPRAIENPRGVARRLSPLLQIPEEELYEKLSKKPRAFIWISRRLSDETAKAVENLNEEGLGFITEYKRFYPHMQLASQVIGFSGVDDEGREGLELTYENELMGRDAEQEEGPERQSRYFYGQNLVLTIDIAIQSIVEEELKKTVEHFNAQNGTIVVMDPKTGEVLAMASYPTYNPNIPGESSSAVRRNRAVTDVDEPGSTFKIFTAAALLDQRLVTPEDHFHDPGWYRLYNHTIHSYHPMGDLTFRQAIEKSSNIAVIKAALLMEPDLYYTYLKNFGFGERTGIEFPGEADGVLRSPSRWSGISQAMMAIGHEISATPIQTAAAAAAVANGGMLLRPQLIREIRDPQGNVVRSFEKSPVRRVLRPEVAAVLNDILEGVVEEGTGTQAQVAGFKVAGKTGTGQRPDRVSGGYAEGSYTSSFVGWLPAEDPAILTLVIIRSPDTKVGYYGGAVAAPAFSRIASRTMNYLEIYPSSQAAGSPLRSNDGRSSVIENSPQVLPSTEREDRIEGEVGEDYVIIPDLRGSSMREVYSKLSLFPLALRVEGSGVAVRQQPSPGAKVSPGAEIRVVFSQESDTLTK